jgi:hypothetical protein
VSFKATNIYLKVLRSKKRHQRRRRRRRRQACRPPCRPCHRSILILMPLGELIRSCSQ